MRFLKTFLIFIIVFSIGCTTTKAKKENDSNYKVEPIILYSTNDGINVGINRDDLHFIFKLKTKYFKWKELNPTYIFQIDEDTIIQVLTIKFRKNENATNNINEIEVAKHHMKSEIDYFEKELGIKIKSKNEVIQLKEQKALYYKVEIPKERGGAHSAMFLVKKNSFLINLCIPIRDKDEKIIKQLLVDTANTIEVLNTPITTKFMFDYSSKR